MSITMGAYSYGSPEVRGPHNKITIGKYCSFGQNCILDGGFDHNYGNVSTYPFNPNMEGCGHLPLNKTPTKDINIGNDVWFGESCVIMQGVTIGDGAVIGIRSIITKDIEHYTIVVGANRVIGKRFTNSQIDMLLTIKWWNWPEERVRANAHLLLSEDIDNFILNHI